MAYKTRLIQLSLTDPPAYYKLREEVLTQVQKEAVQTQYKVYYNLLHNGMNAAGTAPVVTGGDAKMGMTLEQIFKPCVPRQECNKFAIAAAKPIHDISEAAIEMLLPKNYKNI